MYLSHHLICYIICYIIYYFLYPRNEILFSSLEKRAREVYVRTLWNGQYLYYDSSSSTHHDSIMADMMAGKQ